MKDCFVYIEYNNLLPVFYYESDHLGSASYVTNDNGQVTQTLNYLPYGEDWVDLQYFDLMPAESNLGVYKFNGKEKDAESGYNYYGARYYDSEKISWLSVDPMSDKYPNLSPYVYCADNPVKLIDPDGKEIDPESDKAYVQPYEDETKARMNYIDALRGTDKFKKGMDDQYKEYSNILNEIGDLRSDKKNLYTIKTGAEGLGENVQGVTRYGGSRNGMNLINIDLATKEENPVFFLSIIAHELKHAYQFYNGALGFVIENGKQISSSDSKMLEKEAFTRGNMFSGNTMLNNGRFNLNHNLDYINYSLPNYDNYNKMPNGNEYNINQYDNFYNRGKTKFIMNKKI